ncbi:intradiol ring-cleavage dioxygenase [Microlunatus soli]|uniref:Protocatechuate 3,4-dioxygenase beta subunit n=1 Tax=Microlunatus soli TaxID=630515 RepID=A0A1H1XH11_9ACTN|nr:intradiol ring-cleavage dioxygenase [Microlunatus soli]SDT07966.1 Protocatechuate 3,4-dioxygenase beta subunit [Microlunatus soli]
MPIPDRTERSYQGRRLPRQDEELVDQGLSFDVGTLLNRRRVLALFGTGAAVAGLAACGASDGAVADAATNGSSTMTEIPDETAGPYPGDGSNGPDVLEESGIVRSDIRSSFGTGSATAEGVPMTLQLTILDMTSQDAPFEGVAVYVWHCDRDGQYSMYADNLTEENYLRGVQLADADGRVTFTSIFPACYSGRWPHIHFEVYPDADSITDAGKAIATSQVALPQKACDRVYAEAGYEQSVTNLKQVSLDNDNVFGDDGGQHQLGKVTGSIKKGLKVTLDVPVDTSTEPTGGDAPGGAGQPPSGAAPSGAPTADATR